MTKLFRCNRYCLRLNYTECWKSSDLIWSNLVLFNQIWSDFICLCHSILLTLIWNPVIHSYQIQFCLPFFYFISSDPIQPHILSSVLKSWPLIISKFNCCHFISSDQIYFLPIRSDPISSNIMQSCLKSCDLIWDYMVFSDLISQLESSDFMISESISSYIT